jgi:hypothetical protein
LQCAVGHRELKNEACAAVTRAKTNREVATGVAQISGAYRVFCKRDLMATFTMLPDADALQTRVLWVS